MKVKRLFQFLKNIFYFKFIFGSIGPLCVIVKPLKIDGAKNIYIGNKSFIAYKTWLAALPLTNEKECKLIIGEGCKIGHFNHIYATHNIKLGNNVLTSDKVYISDNLHHYEDTNLPIMHQGIKQVKSVDIGDGSWLGENVCVIGATIGRNCVIGANSVVTKDIPSYSVAVGTPAKVIKQYNKVAKKWERVGNSNI